jgi:hypothetical protein
VTAQSAGDIRTHAPFGCGAVEPRQHPAPAERDVAVLPHDRRAQASQASSSLRRATIRSYSSRPAA